MRKLYISAELVSLLIVVYLAVSCVVNPVTGKRQLMLMSEEQEIQMGNSYDPQVVATFGEYPDKNLQTFVQARGDEIGKISHRPNLTYHVKVLDSPVVNAFAVPGGYIYITRGIIAQLNNEAELMGVMSHEIGHVAARHTVAQQSKQTLGQILLIGGMIASEKFAEYAGYAMQGMQLLFLRFSRDDEREADRLGVEYSSKLGYDAHQMAEFFKVLSKMTLSESEGGIPTFLSTHPDPGDRYNSVNAKATEWQTKLDRPDWKVNQDSYLQMIDGLVYGEDPRQGYVEGNVFYHPEMRFRFTFPAGWKLENSPLQVSMVPGDNKALLLFSLSQQKTPDASADSLIARLGLTLQNKRTTMVNGLPAVVTLCKQSATDKSTGTVQTNIILSYFVSYGNSVFGFHGVSGESDFNTYSGAFEASMGSFSRLTDNSKINVKPYRINVLKVPRTGTFESALSSLGVNKTRYNELALLNDLELNSQVQAGRLIKIISQ
jgi:predicted Zn-dependent protease